MRQAEPTCRAPLEKLLDVDYDPHVSASAQSEEATVCFEGFMLSRWREVLYRFGIVFTLGALWLIARWFPKVYIRLNCTPSSLYCANRVCAKV
jgi:hypothetical protein